MGLGAGMPPLPKIKEDDMGRAVTRTVYQYGELSEKAKEKAREWWRDGGMEYDWWDGVFEDTVAVAEILGIDLIELVGKPGQMERKTMILFRGFWSQGDGACFEGRYEYAKGSVKRIREYAPKDKELHRIARELSKVQRRYWYRMSAEVKHTGHYCHEYSTSIAVESDEEIGGEMREEDEVKVAELLRDFMRWIYKRLKDEYEYLTSDEVVAETIESNEYEFLEDGSRA